MKEQVRSTKPANCCRRINADGHRQLVFETPAGQRITLQDGPSSILIEDRNGNSVRLEAGGITIQAAAKVTLNASIVELSASEITVNAGLTKFNGTVQAETIIAGAIVPGSGNVW
jgi:phage gp45-like